MKRIKPVINFTLKGKKKGQRITFAYELVFYYEMEKGNI